MKNDNKLVKVKKPTKSASGSTALAKYKKFKKLYKFFALKKEVGLSFTSGDETKLKKYKAKMEKARKLAAPELIRLQRTKKSAIGRGKKRGGVGGMLSKLSSKN